MELDATSPGSRHRPLDPDDYVEADPETLATYRPDAVPSSRALEIGHLAVSTLIGCGALAVVAGAVTLAFPASREFVLERFNMDSRNLVMAASFVVAAAGTGLLELKDILARKLAYAECDVPDLSHDQLN